MFAVFGLGISEIIVLAIVGLLIFGVPILAILIALAASKQSKRAAPVNEVALLRAEVQQLREEVDRLKQGGSTGIQV